MNEDLECILKAYLLADSRTRTITDFTSKFETLMKIGSLEQRKVYCNNILNMLQLGIISLHENEKNSLIDWCSNEIAMCNNELLKIPIKEALTTSIAKQLGYYNK